MNRANAPARYRAEQWETIRYALESNARTARLCLIMLIMFLPPGAVLWLAVGR